MCVRVLFLPSPRLPPTRASMPEGGVSGEKSYVSGGWVANEEWKPCGGIELRTEDVQ